jgi:antitoxin VapB
LGDIRTDTVAETTKVGWSGRSQAVRPAKEFRFDTDTVRIRWYSKSILPEDWEWLEDVTGPVDEDFERAATEQPPQQDRPELDFFE